MAEELPKSSRLFYDFYHFTNQGAEEVATIVFRHLESYLRRIYPDLVER